MANPVRSNKSRFDYGIVSDDRAKTLRELATYVQTRERLLTRTAIKVGLDLLVAKDILDFGDFEDWCFLEAGLHPRTAQSYMRLARFAEGNHLAVAGLGLTAACRLAAPSTPKHVIATVLERVKQGERVTLNEIDDLLQAEKNRCAGALTIRAGDVEASKICALVDGIGAALASPLIEELTEFIEIATPAALQLFKTELRARKHPIADPTTCPQLPS